MSPELVDEAILAHCRPRSLKVARVISDTAQALGSSGEAAFYFIADRIKALVEVETLEGAGDLDRWGYSEVRLPEKNASEAAAAASRRHQTPDQGT
jgi:hypothetical protein